MIVILLKVTIAVIYNNNNIKHVLAIINYLVPTCTKSIALVNFVTTCFLFLCYFLVSHNTYYVSGSNI